MPGYVQRSLDTFRCGWTEHARGLLGASVQARSDMIPAPASEDPELQGQDAISCRTRANHSLAAVSIDELEQLLTETDGALEQTAVDPEGEYARFLQFFTGGLDLPEDEEDDEDFMVNIDDLCDHDFGTTPRRNRPRRLMSRADGTFPDIRSAGFCPLVPRSPSVLTQSQYSELYAQISRHTQLLIQIYLLSIYGSSAHCQLTITERVATCAKASELLRAMVSTSEKASAVKAAEGAPFFHPDALNVFIMDPSMEQYMNCIIPQSGGWRPVSIVPVRTVLDIGSIRILGTLTDAVTQNPPNLDTYGPIIQPSAQSSARDFYCCTPEPVKAVLQRFQVYFDPELKPQRNPLKMRADSFTPGEDALLALGVRRYGTKYDLIREAYLPGKTKDQMKIRMKNSRRFPGHPLLLAKASLTDPLTAEEVRAVQAGLKKFTHRHRWRQIANDYVPRVPPSMLPKLYAQATGAAPPPAPRPPSECTEEGVRGQPLEEAGPSGRPETNDWQADDAGTPLDPDDHEPAQCDALEDRAQSPSSGGALLQVNTALSSGRSRGVAGGLADDIHGSRAQRPFFQHEELPDSDDENPCVLQEGAAAPRSSGPSALLCPNRELTRTSSIIFHQESVPDSPTSTGCGDPPSHVPKRPRTCTTVQRNGNTGNDAVLDVDGLPTRWTAAEDRLILQAAISNLRTGMAATPLSFETLQAQLCGGGSNPRPIHHIEARYKWLRERFMQHLPSAAAQS